MVIPCSKTRAGLWKSPQTFAVVVAFAVSVALVTNVAGQEVRIANFNSGVQTEQGGFFRVIGGDPNQVRDTLVTLGDTDSLAWRIDISADAAAGATGGLIPLFDETNGSKSTTRAVRGKHLLIRVRGQLGERRLRVEFSTHPSAETPATAIGFIEPEKLEPQTWKTIRLCVPSDQFYGTPVTFVRLLAEGSGPAWFAIDALAFSNRTTLSPTPPLETPQRLRRALWVWETESILADEAKTGDLLALCIAHGITDLFCQIPYSYDGQIHIRNADELRTLNVAVDSMGITVHALDGQADFVLRENHDRLLHLLDAIAELNRDSAPAEQYRAVHFDNEPYILPAWREAASRQELIQQYIELNQKLRRRADEARLAFGVDIPFWWDSLAPDGTAKFVYQSADGGQPILEALFPLLDNVGIMSYRDRVTGPNGLVAHCLSEFALGQQHGVDVLAGMELGVGAAVEPGTTFGVYPWPYFRGQLATLELLLPRTPGCAGMAIHFAKPFAKAME